MNTGHVRIAVQNFIAKHESYQRGGHKSRRNIRMRGIVGDAWNSLDQELRPLPVRVITDDPLGAAIRIRHVLGMRIRLRVERPSRPTHISLSAEGISREWVKAIDASVNKPRRISDRLRRAAAEHARVQLLTLCAQHDVTITR